MKIAVYKCKNTGENWELHTNKYRSLWWEIPNQNIIHCINTTREIIVSNVKEGVLLKDDIYHSFHVCYCPQCNGKAYSHSQGDWDSHLRYIANENILTLPTGQI